MASLGLLWAILAAVVGTFVLGFLWYGPLLGKPWMKAIGMDQLPEEEMKRRQQAAMPGYATSIGGTILATILLWFLYGWAVAGATYSGPMLGMAIGTAGWLGFYLPGTLTSRFFETRGWAVTWIGAGYWLVCALIQGIAVGLFH
ncbi:MAG TPA: DUF1761 domain-containing protein [Candidatus Thermoplasmatota archaeon]|nr:DUF1761 domain-containing protein [Candidatus Thermoplasmatota archaeon]